MEAWLLITYSFLSATISLIEKAGHHSGLTLPDPEDSFLAVISVKDLALHKKDLVSHKKAIHKTATACLSHCYLFFFNTLKPRQNALHSTDNIFKCIFLNEMCEFQ